MRVYKFVQIYKYVQTLQLSALSILGVQHLVCFRNVNDADSSFRDIDKFSKLPYLKTDNIAKTERNWRLDG